MRLFVLIASIVLLVLSAADQANAQSSAAESLCDSQASKPTDHQPPEGISKPLPSYPARALSDWSEGWAEFDLTVATDGTTKDIVVRDYVGATGFVEAAMHSLKDWRYRPAMRNGVPVEAYGMSVDVTFIFEDTGAGARESNNMTFRRRFERARDLIKSGDPAAAAKLMGSAFNDRLDLYEEAMGSYLLALALGTADATNWPRALVHARHAVINNGAYLDPSVKPGAMDLDVLLEAQNGNYREAFCTYRRERTAGTQLSPQTMQLGEKIAALLSGREPLVIPGEVFADDRPRMRTEWVHPVLRHKFSFSAIKGALKSLHLQCTATTLDAPIDEETQWTVPPDAGYCTLFVYGDPRTTFQLIEEE
ncbi:MAG: TonB family protein [Alphaproteobacteria bacterium]|nr:TonB family protein [Alphaproteobacteria bacterium]